MPQFQGFSPKTLKFLQELAANNNREWFAEHKPRYESLVLEPALDFITSMQPELQKISEHFDAIPKRVGGSLMRVYRDTRFSKDKTPYKTNIGIQFRHQAGKDVHAPGFYMHIEPQACFLGMGMWHPEPKALLAIRQRIVEHPETWSKVAHGKAFRRQFELGGQSLKRPPKGFAEDSPHLADLKRKDFIATTEFQPKVITSTEFVSSVARSFKQASAYMKFLCDAVQVPF